MCVVRERMCVCMCLYDILGENNDGMMIIIKNTSFFGEGCNVQLLVQLNQLNKTIFNISLFRIRALVKFSSLNKMFGEVWKLSRKLI